MKKETKYKIAGEFLKIEETPTGFRIYYMNEFGKIWWFSKSKTSLIDTITNWEVDIPRLQKELSKTSDPVKAGKIKSNIEWRIHNTLWPEMYKAYCRGENLDRFFSKRIKQQEVYTGKRTPYRGKSEGAAHKIFKMAEKRKDKDIRAAAHIFFNTHTFLERPGLTFEQFYNSIIKVPHSKKLIVKSSEK